MRLDDAIANTSTANSPTDLYRYFADDGHLIYVGISKSAVLRSMQHEQSAHWWESWSTMTRERFARRDLALAAERAAIIHERPRCNVVHSIWQEAG